MSIATIHSEFTNDLESFVKNPIQIEPLSKWDPRKPAAPERHAVYGKNTDLSIDTQFYMLESQNKAFETIASMVRVIASQKMYESFTTVDPVKEQAWLFGYKWLSIYYDLLAEPRVMRSEFYRREHDRFIGLLGKLMSTSPTVRISFIDALRLWYPRSGVLTDFTIDEPLFVSVSLPPIVSVSSVAVLPLLPVPLLPVLPDDHAKILQEVSPIQMQMQQPCDCPPSSVKHRLVLARSRDSVGHNKTRRNLRN